MRAVVQRVSQASVTVEGRLVGQIQKGFLVYLGIGRGDTAKDLEYIAQKVFGLRVFADDRGAMNRSLVEAGGAVLAISQFTLYGDVRRGKRPSFRQAMEPAEAEKIFDQFLKRIGELGLECTGGIFGAMMDIRSTNDGPVTILLDSSKLF